MFIFRIYNQALYTSVGSNPPAQSIADFFAGQRNVKSTPALHSLPLLRSNPSPPPSTPLVCAYGLDGIRILALRRSVIRGSDSPPDCHSLPLLRSHPFLSATKKPYPFGYGFSGGEKGIRTLERVLAVTRFPIVRLRPAQPPLRATATKLLYIRKPKKSSVFIIFLQYRKVRLNAR